MQYIQAVLFSSIFKLVQSKPDENVPIKFRQRTCKKISMQSQHHYNTVLHTQSLGIQQNQLNVQSVLLKQQLDITTQRRQAALIVAKLTWCQFQKYK